MTCFYKKGDIESKMLVGMILAVVILLISVVFYKNVIDTSKEIAKTETCKRSVQVNSIKLKPKDTLLQGAKEVMEIFSDQFGNPVRLDCSTRYINVYEKDPEAIKKRIADEMVDAWDTYGEGDRELFDTKDNNYCVIFTRMTFKEEVEIDDFIVYLQNHNAPNKGMTYFKYLEGVQMANFIPYHYQNSGLAEYDHFTTNFPLAVIYYMGKDAYPDAFVEASRTKEAVWMSGGGLIAGAFAGGVLCMTGVGCGAVLIMVAGVGGAGVGAGFGYSIGSDRSADWDARIQLWNYNEIKNLDCTYLEAKSTPLKIVDEPLIDSSKKNI